MLVVSFLLTFFPLIRYNEEINTLLKGEDIVRFTKSENKMVGACRKNGRLCNAKENVKRKA
jgi:hypothetical protein